MVIDYKLIQADGNQALAAEVMRFVRDGWEPHGAPFIYSDIEMDCFMVFQAIILRETESAELRRLRWLLAEATEACTAVDMGQVDEKSALAHIAATLVQCDVR